MEADWLTALNGVGGPFVPAALDFVRFRRCGPPESGAAGIRWLADQVERHLDADGDWVDDDRFVEGAGALLGLLLIEHLGGRTAERDGVHRIQIGRFGWFDPFEAVENALDAEQPRRCLSEYLSAAEREATGGGPVSRVVRLFADVLSEERPDLAIESQFELVVELSNGASVDLTRLERVSRDQDDAATAEAAKRITSMLPGASGPKVTSWSEAVSRILPRLISESFLRSLPGDQSLYAEALCADVYLALQLRYEARARYVPCLEVDSWPIAQGEARRRAIANLAERSRKLRLEPVAEGIVRLRRGDGLDAARLLLPDLSARLGKIDASATWLAAAPHRDVLLLARDSAIEQLARLADDASRRAPHPISPVLFAVTSQGLHPM